ncbi:hypothetical protein HB979_11865 [Listeria welshimeri]|nr:hypothetical protein [Listeria welshimeri]MBC1861685.1 hypothetical protein [Listeria welshimeri]MBC2281847.1 hypothetical protein [Listeria welshimeri]MBC2672999.1 hypothetical protein [Listeria welshimeri]
MSRIGIGEIRTFALQLKEANQQGKRCIKAIQTVVTNYAEEDSLKGKAIDASKNYYQMTYVPLCKAILEVMEESQERLRQYMDDFHDQVDSSPNARIDEEGLFELGQQIDRLEAKKETLAQRMNVGTEGQMQIYRSQLSQAYKKENIAEKYLAFEQSHTDFFAHISDLVQNIQQTIRELQSNIQFNHHTGTYDITKLDLDTVSRLQQALGKESNTQPKIFPFNEYQKTYTGTTWILTRGGIIDVGATTAYNEAILHGELPPESNQAIEDAELLKGIIASVKAGKDPLTGQEISLLQGISIIAGTTFMYTAGAYHGKRMGIPKLKGVLRRKKTGGLGKNIENVNPSKIRFSQTSVNGSDKIIASMKANGWKGDPIDVVKMPDGSLTTLDNTRVAAAREAGIDVQATVRNYDDLLPPDMVARFTTPKGVPKTWGEATDLRIGKQKASFRNNNPMGSFDLEKMK